MSRTIINILLLFTSTVSFSQEVELGNPFAQSKEKIYYVEPRTGFYNAGDSTLIVIQKHRFDRLYKPAHLFLRDTSFTGLDRRMYNDLSNLTEGSELFINNLDDRLDSMGKKLGALGIQSDTTTQQGHKLIQELKQYNGQQKELLDRQEKVFNQQDRKIKNQGNLVKWSLFVVAVLELVRFFS